MAAFYQPAPRLNFHSLPVGGDGDITHYDEFSGIGGTSDGARFVPGVRITDAANHDPDACKGHADNFPDARHYQEDVTKLDLTQMPRVDLFTASPACPAWTDANGIKRDFDKVNAEQQALFDLPGIKPDDPKLAKRRQQYKRSRLLMYEVPKYLRAMAERDPRNPVLIGMVENVIQCRLWSEWVAWLNEIIKLGYYVRVIAFNAMHARPVRAPWAPQSRDRLYVAFWHKSLGRHPDWDKWLRPYAWCEKCCTVVEAVQHFKKEGADMGRYKAQYIYVCPNRRCEGQQVFPEAVPALAAIDLSRPGTRIGDRAKLGMPDLKPNTLARIKSGMQKHWAPLLVPVGGTWRGKGARGAVPLADPAPARTTRETDGIAVPPFMVPVEGRAELNRTYSVTGPGRTCTTRAETGLAMPFLTTLRGGGSKRSAKPVTEPAGTVTASGNHHGLAMLPPAMLMRNTTQRGNESRCTPVTDPAGTVVASARQTLLTLGDALMVPYYRTGVASPVATEPSGTLTTRARYGIATPDGMLSELPPLDDVLFRMLEDDEIGRLMGFGNHFQNNARAKATRVRLYGNAVCPAAAEVIVSALVECMTGEELPRELVAA